MDTEYIFDDDLSVEEIYLDDINQVNELSKSTLINLYNAFKREENLQLRDYICKNRSDIMGALNLNEIDIYEKSKDEIMYDIKQKVKYTDESSAFGILKISEVFYHSIITAISFTLYNIVTKNGERIKERIDSITNIKLKSQTKQVYSLDKKYMLKELNTIESILNKFIGSYMNTKIKITTKKEYESFVKKIETTIKPLEKIIGFEILRLANDSYKIFKDKEKIDDKYIQKKSYISLFKFKKETDVNEVLKKLSDMQYTMDNKHMKLLENVDDVLSKIANDVVELKNKDDVYYNRQAIKFQFDVFKVLIQSKTNSMKKILSALNNILDKTPDEDVIVKIPGKGIPTR